MASSDIDICNQALARLGSPEISSFTDGSPNSVTCAQNYPDFKRFLLSVHSWHFNDFQRELGKRANFDPIGYNAAFTLPADKLTAPQALYSDTSGTIVKDFRIIGDDVHCDCEQLFTLYSRDLAEVLWPPGFTTFVIVAFAAEITMAVTERNSLADRLERKAWGSIERRDGGLYLSAKQEDTRRGPTRSIIEGGGPLLRARGGTHRGFRGPII